MAQLCGKSEDEVISELGDNIYCNPAKNNGDKYSGWETAEEYLSGYTKQKLGLAMVKAEENPDLFSRNVKALKEHQPPFIPIVDIGFRLGSIHIMKIYFPLEIKGYVHSLKRVTGMIGTALRIYCAL